MAEVVRFEDLRFDERLKDDGMGEVWRGGWRGTAVMIKRLKMEPQLLATAESKAAFVSEAPLLLCINSPRILLLMGFTETEPLCLVWECWRAAVCTMRFT